MLYMIACVGKKNEIGYKNKLLWNIPEDMERFKRITMGDTLIMGRKTYESIGRELPGRTNIVMSRNIEYITHMSPIHMSDMQATILWAIKQSKLYNIGIIGGSEIYEAFIDYVDKVYLTEVHHSPKTADSYFPVSIWNRYVWEQSENYRITSRLTQDNKGKIEPEDVNVDFSTYTRKREDNGFKKV